LKWSAVKSTRFATEAVDPNGLAGPATY
jgi:hypothetical protein